MGTITRTGYDTSRTPAITGTFWITYADAITVSGDTVPAHSLVTGVSAYWAYYTAGTPASTPTGYSQANMYLSGYQLLYRLPTTGMGTWAADMQLPLSLMQTNNIPTSVFFNSKNRYAKTITYTDYLSNLEVFIYDASSTLAQWRVAIPSETVSLGKMTLNAPPTIGAMSSSSRNGVYWTEDLNGVANSKIMVPLTMKYSAYCAEYTLTLGSWTYTETNKNSTSFTTSIPLTDIEAGTYTPVMTVTDTRGQTTTKTFDPITIQQYVPSTYDITQVQSDKATGFYANNSAASVTIDNISVPTGYTLESAKLTIGSDTVTQTLDGTETSITLSVPLTETGTFTPDVYITDSRGISEHNYLNPITVNAYVPPTANVTADRVTSFADPTSDDEGVNVLITAEFTFTAGVYLEQPVVTVENDTASVTWYETLDANGLSDQVNWSSYSPNSPVTLYGFSSGYGSTTGYNTGLSFQLDITPVDDVSIGTTILATVSQAFFTVDFLAGGHGIAFGKLATNIGFECAMDAKFKDNNNVMRALFDFIYPVGSYYETSDTTFDPNITWGGTWSLETEGLVHIGAGSNYTAGDTGGEATHKLTVDEMPSHNHDLPRVMGFVYSTAGGNGTYGSVSTWTTVGNRGGDQAHNNMQPYIVVNRWHRTA